MQIDKVSPFISCFTSLHHCSKTVVYWINLLVLFTKYAVIPSHCITHKDKYTFLSYVISVNSQMVTCDNLAKTSISQISQPFLTSFIVAALLSMICIQGKRAKLALNTNHGWKLHEDKACQNRLIKPASPPPSPYVGFNTATLRLFPNYCCTA